MLLACLLRVEAVSKKYNMKEGRGMGACDGLVLGGVVLCVPEFPVQ